MEETIMNQEEIMEETAMAPAVTETEEVDNFDNYDIVEQNDECDVGIGVVLAIGALIGIGAKVAYDKVGKPLAVKIKEKMAATKAEHDKLTREKKAKKAKENAVDVEEEIQNSEDDIQESDD